MLDNDEAKEIREAFPIMKSLVYLDNAATTQKPKQVIDSIKKYYEEQNANVHRGVYKLSEEATEEYEKAHNIVGKLVNADKDEIIFTRGTTESINLLAYSLGSLAKGKEILLTEMEHHSNLVPWQQFAKRHDMKLKFIPVKNFVLEEVEVSEDTAIMAINHVSNALGTINDVKKLVKKGKEKGAITIVDGAQSVPHMNVDVKSIGCDFLAFSGHKMCGPTGIGTLYGKKELLEKMGPFNYGGDMIRSVTYEDAQWNDLPWKFEAGTPNISGGIGMGKAVEYLQKIGLENIEKREKELLAYALTRFKQLKNVEVYNPGIDKSSGILSFNIKDVHPHDVASILDDDNICVRGGHHCAMPLMDKLNLTGTSRASFYLYNTFEDVDALVEGLKKVEGVFK